MHDIFISYAREDKLRIEPIVKFLENKGWSVWWDWKSIPIGKTWRQFVDEGLRTSRSILVIWSKISITRDWVIEEADVGKEQKMLVPLLIDDVIPPLGFRQIQAARLFDWQGDLKHPGLENLSVALENILDLYKSINGEKGKGAKEKIIFGLHLNSDQDPVEIVGKSCNHLDREVGVAKKLGQTEQRIEIVAPLTSWIRIDNVLNGVESAAKIAHRFGLKVALSAFISKNRPGNENELGILINEAKSGNVDLAIIGHEALFRRDLRNVELMAYIMRFKREVPNVPVTTSEVYGELLQNPSLMAECDIVLPIFHPFWEGINVVNAVAWLDAQYDRLKKLINLKDVIISETGWPSEGQSTRNVVESVEETKGNEAIASPDNSRFYFRNFISWASSKSIKYFYFEAFDTPWRERYEESHSSHWGILNNDGVLKPGIQKIFTDGPGRSCPKCKLANDKDVPICKWCKSSLEQASKPLFKDFKFETPKNIYGYFDKK